MNRQGVPMQALLGIMTCGIVYDPAYMILKSAYKYAGSYVRFDNVICQEAAEGEDGGRKHREKGQKKREGPGGR